MLLETGLENRTGHFLVGQQPTAVSSHMNSSSIIDDIINEVTGLFVHVVQYKVREKQVE